MENEDTGVVSEGCELLIATGNLKCDIFLPAHHALMMGCRHAMKMGCHGSSLKLTATPINFAPIAIIQMLPPLLVRFRMEDENKNIQEKKASLWGRQS